MNTAITVLLVEDNVDDADLLKMAIEQSDGFKLSMVHADNMQAVINAMNEIELDMVISDYNLKGFDARAVLRAMNERKLDTPFVVISGVITSEIALNAIQMGADVYFDKKDLGLLGSWIHRELRISKSYSETIQAFSKLLAYRDDETRGHSDRVVTLSRQLAKQMGLTVTETRILARGATLHDIGKIALKDRVLLKDGPLNEEEWKEMRKHPLIASELLGDIPILEDVVQVPHYHHERWDGTGYPYGLTGKNIPLFARIFAVVDVYDALTSDRPYRPAMSKAETLEHIREQSGVLFDPWVVKNFLEMMEANDG